MTLLALVSLVVWGISIFLLLAGTWYVLSMPLQGDSEGATGDFPAISVLKPLKGLDEGMEANLRSFFHLDYPRHEVLFSVADASDPVIPLVQRLCQEYPTKPVRLTIGEELVGANPKVNNLMRSYREAAHDWILISDSNTRVPPDYLFRVGKHLGPRVGVLTAVVAGIEPLSLGGSLEATYLNTFFARWIHLAYHMGKPFVIGKSMCFSRKIAERFGGIRTLACYIAEDNMMGEAMKRLGYQVKVMSDPIEQYIGNYSVRAFWKRHVRWGRIRKSQAPFAFLLEPLVGATVSAAVGGWAFAELFDASLPEFFLGHFLLWILCDVFMIRRLQRHWRLETVFVWLIREVLSVPLWLQTVLGNSVSWRGSTLRLMPGGLLESNDE